MQMKKARMNISHSRFILFKLKVFGEIVTTLGNKRTVFWKKKEKKTHRFQKWVGRDERVS